MGFLFDNGADEHLKKAAAEFNSVTAPSIEEQRLQLQEYVTQGVLTPDEAEFYMQQASEMGNVVTDPSLKQAQYDALASLQEIGNEGGLTAMDKAKLQSIQTQENASARGQREAIMQNAQERGMGSSGMSIMAQLQNQQDSATRASQRGMDVAAMAQERALQALQQAGQLGGQMQQTDFNQKAEVAKQNDAINQFNTQNRTQVGLVNTNAANDAKKFNLTNSQDIANKNTELSNTQQAHNKGLAQTKFNNDMSLAAGKAGIYQSQADAAVAEAEGNKKLLGGIISGGAAVAASDEKLKEDIEEFDASDFLDSITGYKYRYKNPKAHGEGKQVGIMAQDLEKVLPQMVKEGPDGKVIDYEKAGGPIFATMAALDERLKKVEGKK